MNASPSSSATATTAPFLYVSSSNGNIAGFSSNSSSGALTLLSGSPTSAGSSASLIGIAVLPSDDFLYVVDAAGNAADSFGIGTYGGLTSVGSTATGKSPYGIAINPAGSFVYVSNFGAGTIDGYTVETSPTDGLLVPLSSNPIATGMSGPEGLAITPDGALLYAADNKGGLVDAFAINSDGTLSFISKVDSLGTVTGNPRQIAVAPGYPNSPFVYVTDVSSTGGVVSQFTVQSNGSLAFTASFATGKSPIGVVLDPSGSCLYTANSGDSTVYQFLVTSTPTPGSLSGLGAAPAAPSPGLSAPFGIVTDDTGAFVYVANSGNGTVSQYDINSSTCALIAEATVATGTSGPTFLAFVP